MVDGVRIKTMRERLGEASKLIDSDMFLPMYRNRQKAYPELFQYSIELAKKKNEPSHYFASIWGKKNLKKSLEWLQKLVTGIKSKLAELFRREKNAINEAKIQFEAKKNIHNINRLAKMKLSYGLRS